MEHNVYIFRMYVRTYVCVSVSVCDHHQGYSHKKFTMTHEHFDELHSIEETIREKTLVRDL